MFNIMEHTGMSEEELREQRLTALKAFQEVERFFGSDLGGVFIEKASEYREAAIERLLNTSPLKQDELAMRMIDAKLPDLFILWLEEIIRAGQLAYEDLKEEHEASATQ